MMKPTISEIRLTSSRVAAKMKYLAATIWKPIMK